MRDSLVVGLSLDQTNKQAKSTLSRLSTMFGALKSLGLEVSSSFGTDFFFETYLSFNKSFQQSQSSPQMKQWAIVETGKAHAVVCIYWDKAPPLPHIREPCTEL